MELRKVSLEFRTEPPVETRNHPFKSGGLSKAQYGWRDTILESYNLHLAQWDVQLSVSPSDVFPFHDSGLLPRTMTPIRSYILRGASWSAAVQVLNTALSFAASVLLARLLGVTGYGAYQYTMGWIALLGTLAGFGLGRVVERELAVAVAKQEWARVKGAVRFGYLVVALVSVALAVILLALTTLIPGEKGALFATAAFLLPIQALLGLSGAVLLGFKRVVQSSLPNVLHMCAFVALLVVVWLVAPTEGSLEPDTALYLQMAAAGVALALGIALASIAYGVQPEWKHPLEPDYAATSWLKAGLPLLLISGMLTINNQADILMLGALVNDEAVGMYHTATRMANFIAFALGAMIVPMRPLMSEFNSTGQQERLQRMVTKSIRAVFLLTLPLAVVFIFFGGPLLGWIYGDAFREAASALALLSIAQLLNVAAGPVQALLVMCSHEKTVAWGVALSTFVNVALNSILIPLAGIEGAAIATGLSLVIWNLVLVRETERRLSVRPTVIGPGLSLIRRAGLSANETATR